MPKSRGAKEQMSDLESTLPSGIRQNRDQVGYVPLSELKYRAQAETIKKSEIAKLMQRSVVWETAVCSAVICFFSGQTFPVRVLLFLYF